MIVDIRLMGFDQQFSWEPSFLSLLRHHFELPNYITYMERDSCNKDQKLFVTVLLGNSKRCRLLVTIV